MTENLVDRLHRGLIVSCQADHSSPLYGPEPMSMLARAAVEGGAVGIRARGTSDVAMISQAVEVPIIGLTKRGSSGVYITPAVSDAVALEEAGADLIAVDATLRLRPDGTTMTQFMRNLKQHVAALIVADIDSVEAGIQAAEAGADFVATTLSGYTTPQRSEQPDVQLVRQLVQQVSVPVIAEGRYRTREQVRTALDLGAHAVVVGGAVTDPAALTRRLAHGLT